MQSFETYLKRQTVKFRQNILRNFVWNIPDNVTEITDMILCHTGLQGVCDSIFQMGYILI